MENSSHPIFSQSDLRTFALEICSGDEEIFVELLGDCQTDLRDQFTNLEVAREAQNWRDFNRAAHSMKSAARTFGSPLVKELSFQLEQQSEGGVAEEKLPELDEKTRELQEASKRFEKMLAEIALNPSPFLT
ncbi:Hpt domain-containing protein [Puniceicoccus vermicola]|uniref:Hpt domain-containing protein n=1 Tax=Puniceicoccus vermicola TaxID=388746 RepID=A0A7X1B2E8_9BACT|nr:Hpt domain-containing protein [Puniceicoccus vermicola]MBC2604394.1 Hpt domain-containing protein [Puniceicoccus vermicola]